MHSEWRDEKFLKDSAGGEMRLRFWSRHQKIDLVFMQLARYKFTHADVSKYHNSLPEILANKTNASSPAIDS